jgi:hypothetical protein
MSVIPKNLVPHQYHYYCHHYAAENDENIRRKFQTVTVVISTVQYSVVVISTVQYSSNFYSTV